MRDTRNNAFAEPTTSAKMKRKLNENDIPEEVTLSSTKTATAESFADFGLDPRILKGIQKQQFSVPTQVQNKVIPLALEGKDVLGKCLNCSDFNFLIPYSPVGYRLRKNRSLRSTNNPIDTEEESQFSYCEVNGSNNSRPD